MIAVALPPALAIFEASRFQSRIGTQYRSVHGTGERRVGMSRRILFTALVFLVIAGLGTYILADSGEAATYKVTATAIEACSCPLFCSCYYNTEPSGGHMCRFNNAYKFEPGSHWGKVDLSGAKVWVTGDLGSHFGSGKTEWAVVSFDRAATPAQRAAINAWIGKVFPVQWGKVEARDDDIAWDNGAETAHAKLGSGQAEITLAKVFDPHGKQSTVTNTPYWAANSNTGFQLAHSTHYYKGEPSFSFEHRNGFVITLTAEGTVEPAAAAR